MINLSSAKRELAVLALMLTLAAVVRVVLFPLQGYANDTGTFSYWFNTAADVGVRPFYTVVLADVGWVDYPPFNVYLFWAFGSLAKVVAPLGVNIANIIKLAPTIFDLATSALIYLFMRKQFGGKAAFLSTALYAFNPAIIFNVAVWGQFDAIYTFFMVLSLVLVLLKKPEFSAFVFALGLLTKPQSIALLPLIAYLVYRKSGFKHLLTSVATFVGTVFLVILPFEWSNPVTFLSRIYTGAYDWYHYTSINAFNLWGMFGMWVPDGSLYILGWIMFGSAAAFTLFVLHKKFKVSGDTLAIFAAFMLFFSFFMLPTRIHERYMFPAISMLALMFPLLKRTRILFVALTATLFVNEAYVLYWLNISIPYAPNLTGDPVVLAIGAVNLLMLLYASILLWFELKGYGWLGAKSAATETNQPHGIGETPSKSTST